MKRVFIFFNLLLFNILLSADKEKPDFQTNFQPKDHFIILYNNKEDRDKLLQKMDRLSQTSRIRIYHEALIETNNHPIYGAKIPFSPAMSQVEFYSLLYQNLGSNLLNNNVFAKELKSDITYTKLEVNFRSLPTLIKLLTVLISSGVINLRSNNFLNLSYDAIHAALKAVITFSPIKINQLMNVIDNINPEVKSGIINLKCRIDQFL